MDDAKDMARSGSVRAFRIVAAILGVLLILLSVPFAVVSIVSDEAADSIHRFHNTAGAIATLILAAGLLALARTPWSIASMQLLVAGAVVSLVVGLLAGDLFTGFLFVPAVAVGILLVLYPGRARVWRLGDVRIGHLVIAVIAFVPAIAYVLTHANLQRHALPGDLHAEMHHYSGVAVTALALPVAALVAAAGGRGWRIVAWIAAVAFMLFGVCALAFSGYMSAPPSVWGWASVVGGLALAATTEWEARGATADVRS